MSGDNSERKALPESSLSGLFRDIDASSVNYCVLHGWQTLPDWTRSDIDIAVEESHLGRFERALRGPSGWDRIVQLLKTTSNSYCFVLAHPGCHEWAFQQIDASTDYRHLKGCIIPMERALSSPGRYRGIRVASPEVEFGYLLAKKVAKGVVPPHQMAHLGELANLVEWRRAQDIAGELFGPRMAERVLEYIKNAERKSLEMETPALRRSMLVRGWLRDPLMPVRYWSSEIGRSLQRFRYPTGLVVAILGPDGSGKTALVENLGERVAGAFLGVAMCHLRPDVVLRRQGSGPVTDPHGQPTRPWWQSCLKMCMFVLDYRLGYLFKVNNRIVRSHLVLFDRHFDDIRVDPRRYRVGGSGRIAEWARRLIPTPDLVLCLDAPADALTSRKCEVGRNALQDLRPRYRKITTETAEGAILDASLPAGEVAADAADIVVAILRERYLDRRHIWFGPDGDEGLEWLSRVLCPTPDAGRLRAGRESHPEEPGGKQVGGRAFHFLRLRDGSGYLIPTAPRKAAISGLSLYTPGRLLGKVRRELIRAGLSLGLGRLVGLTVQLVSGPPPSREPGREDTLLDGITGVLSTAGVQGDLLHAVWLGNPGPFRKPVIQVMHPDGRPVAYVKVGWDDRTRSLVMNETGNLRALQARELNFGVPRLLHEGEWQGRYLCVQAAPDDQRTAPGHSHPCYFEAVAGLAALGISWRPLLGSEFWTTLGARVAGLDPGYNRRLLSRSAEALAGRFGGLQLPFHYSHGDLAPWNAAWAGGRLYLFDWEHGSSAMPAGWDLLHLYFQNLWLIRKASPLHAFEELSRGTARRQIAAHLDTVGLRGKEAFNPLLTLYITERLAFYAQIDPAGARRQRYLALMLNLALHEEGLVG